MKQSGGRDGDGDGDGDGGVHRGRAVDAAGGGRGPLGENSGGGDAAPTPRAAGLPPRAPAGPPPRALAGPRVLHRHHDAVDYFRGDESSSREPGALVVSPRGGAARWERPHGAGASEPGAAGQRRSPATALGGRGRLGVGHHRDAVERPRDSEPPSRESGALVVRARGAPRERPEPSAAMLRAPATAHLGHHHDGVVSPRERERWARLNDDRQYEKEHPRGSPIVPVPGGSHGLQGHHSGGSLVSREGSWGARGRLLGFEAHRELSDEMAKPRRGVTSSTLAASACEEVPRFTAAAGDDEIRAEAAPNVGGHQSLGSGYNSSSEPESSSAAHPHPAQGGAMVPGGQVVGEKYAQNSGMVQRILTDLVESEAIMDINFLENWLVQTESLSIQTYFEIYAPVAQRVWYNKWILCTDEYSSHTLALPSGKGFKNSKGGEVPVGKMLEMISAMGDQQHRCQYEDLVKANCKAMYAIREFLCKTCLNPNPNPDLELLCFDIISLAANQTSNNFMIGRHLRLIGIIVIKSVIGSPNVQHQAFKVLTKLARVHANKMMILDFGGISCAAHIIKNSVLGTEPATRMIAVVLESEYGYPKVFKDHLPYHIVKAVGERRLTEHACIEAVLEAVTKVELAKSQCFETLTILKAGSSSKNLILGILLRIATEGRDEEYEY